MADAYLSLGSNLGDGAAILDDAVRRLEATPAIRVLARSSLYRTPPWGKLDQPPFLNAALRVATDLAPHALLARCLAVETELGRVRAERWGPRLIDIDILTMDDQVVADERLTLPHPHLLARAFVLVPLLEIAPDLRVGGQSVRDALARLDLAGIERVERPAR